MSRAIASRCLPRALLLLQRLHRAWRETTGVRQWLMEGCRPRCILASGLAARGALLDSFWKQRRIHSIALNRRIVGCPLPMSSPQKVSHQPLSLGQNIMAGAFAGMAELCCMWGPLPLRFTLFVCTPHALSLSPHLSPLMQVPTRRHQDPCAIGTCKQRLRFYRFQPPDHSAERRLSHALPRHFCPDEH